MTETETFSFKTLNVFINRDYLEDVLEYILLNKDKLTKEEQINFANEFRHNVSVLGFRNPSRAPQSMQLKAYITAFEEKNEVIPFTLNTWTKLNHEMAETVMEWLKSKNWEHLTFERKFHESEGFLDQWPEDLPFEKLVVEFKKDHPKLVVSDDDLILMIIWISGLLPHGQSNI
ncbi:MAG: hypothetical protein ACOX7C_10690 [Brevefilum sp.]|jgi:hypothetical protein